jgi:hypothetical protein
MALVTCRKNSEVTSTIEKNHPAIASHFLTGLGINEKAVIPEQKIREAVRFPIFPVNWILLGPGHVTLIWCTFWLTVIQRVRVTERPPLPQDTCGLAQPAPLTRI